MEVGPVPGCATSVTSHVTRLEILLSCGKCRSSLPSVLDFTRIQTVSSLEDTVH